jgi:hypothetical protein
MMILIMMICSFGYYAKVSKIVKSQAFNDELSSEWLWMALMLLLLGAAFHIPKMRKKTLAIVINRLIQRDSAFLVAASHMLIIDVEGEWSGEETHANTVEESEECGAMNGSTGFLNSNER